MSDSEKIEQLKNEIAMLSAQLKVLKQQHQIDWSKYALFGNGKYEKGLAGERVGISDIVRKTALRLLAIKEEQRGDVAYIRSDNLPRAKKLTKKQAKFVNGFIDEIYPIIEKYALITLNNKAAGGEQDENN